MHTARDKLAEVTGREVEYLEGDGEHTFRIVHPEQPTHWLHIDPDLAAAEGEQGVLKRLGEVVPHLTTKGQSLRIRLMRDHVIAEPAID